MVVLWLTWGYKTYCLGISARLSDKPRRSLEYSEFSNMMGFASKKMKKIIWQKYLYKFFQNVYKNFSKMFINFFLQNVTSFLAILRTSMGFQSFVNNNKNLHFFQYCAAKAFCYCPAIISHRPGSQNILKEVQFNPEKDSRIKRARSHVSLEKSS